MKKLLTLLLALALAMSCMTAFSVAEEATYDGGMTYATGFPITKEPITLKAIVRESASLRPDMDCTEVIQYVAAKTNITLDISYVNADQVSLMFVSGEYPDFAMATGATVQQIADAAAAGDVLALDPYIDEVCPTWKAFFEDYPLAYNNIKSTDGYLYTLPFCNFAPYDRDLRDMFLVNTKWCEELGLETPGTISEYTDFLRAVRDNAGTGTIPENVEPLNFYKDNGVGGYVDFFNFFGVVVSEPGFMSVFDGEVKFMAVDEGCKEVLKYLQSLYAEGLILPESFTDDWNMHFAKVQSKDPVVGSYFAYNNENVDYFKPISPLDAENGTRPSIRRQTYTASGRCFTLFKTNPYPYATMRLMEAIVDYADAEFVETVNVGLQGTAWKYNEDGKITEGYINDDGKYATYYSEDPNWSIKYGWWNDFIGVRTPEWYSDYYFEVQNIAENTRAWAFEAFYREWVNDASATYVSATLDEADNIRLTELQTDITNYRQQSFTNWICNGGDVDAEWDAYVAHMNELGLEEFLELKQKAYDRLMG